MVTDSNTIAKRPQSRTTQIKVTVDSLVAESFRKACAKSQVSMASVLSHSLADYAHSRIKGKPDPEYSTRRQRRSVMKMIIQQMELIKDCEERNLANTPENLIGSTPYEVTRETIASLEDALDILTAFWMVP